MVNYDMDEIERQRERERRSRGIKPEQIWKENEKHRMEIMKNEMKNKVEVELPHKDILKLALLAHEKDVGSRPGNGKADRQLDVLQTRQDKA